MCGGGGVPNQCGAGTCTKTTCVAEGKNCGSIPDKCGGMLSCGSCIAPQSCGGGGTPNLCGCTLGTCGGKCGSPPDGCGGSLTCKGCASTETCNAAFQCVPALKANGASCSAPGQCQSGICAKGICCTQDCTGTCTQCNANGVGCTKAGYDNACPGNGYCSDVGQCGCNNGVKDSVETDVDCGGYCGATCGPNQQCGPNGDSNCASGNCCGGGSCNNICKPPGSCCSMCGFSC